jgi:5-methylcytosine-specific restriction endonuclease McrA
MLVDDELVRTEHARSREELARLAQHYEPPPDTGPEKIISRKARIDNAAQKERIKILENYECQIGGFTFEYTSAGGMKRRFAHADHIVEKSSGGTEKADNLWVLCPNCHAKKTFGVITVDMREGKIREYGKEIPLRHNHHLSWHKESTG